jgi:hypothetical protein
VNRQQTVIEKYLRNKGKIAVITFLQNKIVSPLDIMGFRLHSDQSNIYTPAGSTTLPVTVQVLPVLVLVIVYCYKQQTSEIA